MRAARLVGPRRFEILSDAVTPAPKPGEVLVRMEHVSICGSDLLTYDRVLPEEQYPLRIGAPCHECFGTVEESYDDNIKKGQKVVALSYTGGLVEYTTLPGNRCVPVPVDNIEDPSLWVLCQPVGTVIYAVQQMGSVLGKKVAILGQGPIGLAFTDLVSRAGASRVIVTDVVDHRLEVAKSIGATHTVNAARENVIETINELTGGGADVVVEACGLPETANQVFNVLRVKGQAVIFGMPHGDPVFPFEWAVMYNRLPNIIVTNSARGGDIVPAVHTCVDLVGQGKLDMSYMVSHRLPLTDVGRAYELFSGRKENAVKVLISI